MNRKRLAIAAGLVSVPALLVTSVALSLKYQPTFYQQALAESAPVEVRREHAKVFVQTALRLEDQIRNDDAWSHEFSEEAVNGWLAEELPVNYAELLPAGVAAPRVKFESGMLLVAFQVRHGMWNGVVSGKVRPWMTGSNQLALEIQAARIGLVPVPVDEILGDFVKGMNKAGCRMHWKNTGKYDVLVVDLEGDPASVDRERPVLEGVDLEPKLLRISGRRSSAIAAAPRIADKPE